MFKNAIAHAVVPGFKLDPALLQRQIFTPCRPTTPRSVGFTLPCDHAAELAHHVAGYTVINWQSEDKILPGSVVDEAVEEKCAEIEEREGYKPGRKQRKEIKEQVIHALMPQAFSQKRQTLAVFGGGYLIINTSSPARAEALIESLGNALECRPLVALRTPHNAGAKMADWIATGVPPELLTIDDRCTLIGANDEQVKYVNKSVENEEVRGLLVDGYTPKKLGLTHDDKLSYVLDDQLHLTRLNFIGLEKIHSENADEAFDADITIEAGEIIRLLDYLMTELGGIQWPESLGVDTAGDEVKRAVKNSKSHLTKNGATVTISTTSGEVLAKFGG